MTTTSSTPNSPGPDSPAGGTESPQGNLASQVAAQLAAQSGGSDTDAGKVTTPEELTVDWGGTPRNVKVADLVAAAQKAEDVQQLEAALEKKLKLVGNLDGYKALQDRIDSLSEGQKQKLQSFLLSPDSEDDMSEDDDLDDDDDAEAALRRRVEQAGAEKNGRTRSDPEAKRLDTLEKAVQALVRMAQSNIEQTRAQTVSQQVDQQIENWPALKALREAEPEGFQYFRDQILTQHAMNPEVGLDKLAAKAAKVAQTMVDRGVNGALAPVTMGPDGSVPVPSKPPTKEDLASGGIARMAQQMLDQAARRR